MYSNRKKINEFLKALDLFIEKYWKLIDIDELRDIFIYPFLIHYSEKRKSIQRGRTINVPNLVKIVNSPLLKSDWEFQKKKKTTTTMCVAYGIEYKEVEDISYEHIFYKMCFDNRSIITFVDNYPEYLSKYEWDLKKFLIPVDYNHTMDLLIY